MTTVTMDFCNLLILFYHRHEREIDPEFVAPELPTQTDQDQSDDSMFNYHRCKMAFGLLIRGLEDAVKEGDGQRLFEIAGTLDAVEVILHSIDTDCKLTHKSSYRSVAKREEAVMQVIKDLLSIAAFKFVKGRQGHPSFSKFSAIFFESLDYRQLHKLIKDTLQTWSSIYEKN